MKKLLWFLLLATLAWPQSIPSGSYYVPNYAYGTGGPATGGRIFTGNSVTGVTTITLYSGSVALANGHTITPYATNAAIVVGTGATQETVTPTAVSGCYVGAPIGSCTITANFAFTHIQGEFISSGTYGLQEAINDALASGGGTLIVDSTWGGTTTTITSAHGNSLVAIQDNRTGQALYTWNGSNYVVSSGGGVSPSYQIVTQAFNATEIFNNTSAQNEMFVLTLTGNVTSSSVAQSTSGQILQFVICENATGGWTFAWPTNFGTTPGINISPNACTTAQFAYDTVNAKWQNASTGNGVSPSGSNGEIQINSNNAGLGAIANPTTPNGVSQALVCNPSAGSCTPQFALDSFPPNVQTGNYTVAVTDRGAWISTADSGNDTYTAPDPTASGFGNNFGFVTCNDGTGTITVNRAGTSVFNPGALTTFSIPPHWCTFFISDNTNFYIRRFSDFLGFPGTAAQAALTFNQTSGVIGTLPNIVTQNSGTFTPGNIPKASDANNLQDGYPPLGTDANIPTASSITNGQPVCGDTNGGLSPCTVAGQANYPISYQLPTIPFGLSGTAAVTVANTITATTLISNYEGQQAIPADAMLPSTFGIKTVRIRAFGTFASATTPNLTLTPLLGGVAFGSGFALTSVPASANWQLDFYFTVTGLTTAQYGGCVTYGSTPTQVCISGTATGLNFAASQNVDLQATWSVASASNTITANEITALPVHKL